MSRLADQRILIAISSLRGGGAERVAAALATSWAGQGRDIRIVTLGEKSDFDYPLGHGVAHVALGLAHGSGSLRHRLLGNLRAIGAYRRGIKRYRPDVVVGMVTATNVTIALAAFGLGCAVIGSERASPGHDIIPPLWRVLRRVTYGMLDAVVAQTEGAADWLRRHTFARRVVVVPNPVALPVPQSAPEIRPADVCPESTRVLLGVGRLAPVKRFELLVDAFARVAGDHRDWTLVILGEGPERERLHRLVADHGLDGRVVMPGRAGNMGVWYERASLIALTSHNEGFPNVLLEAMAHGVPVVSVDCPDGPRAIVRDGVDGVLVDPADVEAFSCALSGLLKDQPARTRMGEKAREVLSRFSEQSVLRRWDDALDGGSHAPGGAPSALTTQARPR